MGVPHPFLPPRPPHPPQVESIKPTTGKIYVGVANWIPDMYLHRSNSFSLRWLVGIICHAYIIVCIVHTYYCTVQYKPIPNPNFLSLSSLSLGRCYCFSPTPFFLPFLESSMRPFPRFPVSPSHPAVSVCIVAYKYGHIGIVCTCTYVSYNTIHRPHYIS